MDATFDRYDLYELAAQTPTMQARFLRALHQAPAGEPLTLGEDYCGSGAISCAWVSLEDQARAVCVDQDQEPLLKLRSHLGEMNRSTAARVTIHHADVSDVADPVDLLVALNFSICEIQLRPALVDYLRHARSRLRKNGTLVLDIYGGENAFVTGTSDIELRGDVRYVWEQREADPLTGRVVNAMRFELPDGRSFPDAFVYHWRLWSAPELRDAAIEAGFTRTQIHHRLGDAIDETGAILTLPVEDPDELDENFVVYIVCRT